MLLFVWAMASCTKENNFENSSGNEENTGSGNGASDTVQIGGYGSYNGHDYIDFGLPSGTLWATCNVGAVTPEDYGDYFSWGETHSKNYYDWNTYIYCNGGGDRLTKYCNDAIYGEDGFKDYLTTLQPCDDAARVNWGSGWRMPSEDDWNELRNNTTITTVAQNNVNGYLVTGLNGYSIFLPFAGSRWQSYLTDSGSSCCYWSSDLYAHLTPVYAYCLGFNGNVEYERGIRSHGYSVRPVCSTH